jgi:hypothetical protein
MRDTLISALFAAFIFVPTFARIVLERHERHFIFMIISLSSILSLLSAYRYAALFSLVIIEGLIVTVIAGLAAALSRRNFYSVLGPA